MESGAQLYIYTRARAPEGRAALNLSQRERGERWFTLGAVPREAAAVEHRPRHGLGRRHVPAGRGLPRVPHVPAAAPRPEQPRPAGRRRGRRPLRLRQPLQGASPSALFAAPLTNFRRLPKRACASDTSQKQLRVL